MKPKILVTGAAGFIGGYVVEEMLRAGYAVVGIDSFAKYGRVSRSYDAHPDYEFHEGDVKDTALMRRLLRGCNHLLAGAASIGGIAYFHEHAYDLLAENERITASTFDAAIDAHRSDKLEKITVMSSSMVFESTTQIPTPEGAEKTSPPPLSTYGFQKLACEYFAKGALQQYGLPYTIVRPFNCVGVGERRAVTDKVVLSGNVRLAMSHVVPDLVQKIVKGQDPLRILGDGNQVRHYTYGADLAEGIRLAIEHHAAKNEDFNLATSESTTVLKLAEEIWKRLVPGKPFRHVSDPPFQYDVQVRIPDTRKAEAVLGFRARTTLGDMLDIVIPWVVAQVEAGTI